MVCLLFFLFFPALFLAPVFLIWSLGTLFFFPFLFIEGFFIAYLATKKQRNLLAWFFLGFFLNWLGLLILALLPKKKEKEISDKNIYTFNIRMSSKQQEVPPPAP